MRAVVHTVASRSPFSEAFVKFALVGVTGVAVNSFVLYLLHGAAGLALVPSSIAAIETAILSNFLWNDRWTFGHGRPSIGRFLRFNLVSVGGLGVNLAVLTVIVELTGAHYLLANLAGIVAALAWNFGINVRWTWRSAVSPSDQPPAGRVHEKGADMSDDLVVIPTYDEVENVVPAVHAVLDRGDFDVLVVDDASPDGTGLVADMLAEEHPGRVRVLHRPGKDGLGAAYRAGFAWGLWRGYRRLYQMDADMSHDATELTGMREALAGGDADVVLGSRWVDGGGVEGWPPWRLVVSRFGSLYARLILGMAHRDLTGGFKGFTRPALESIHLDDVRSNGYAFQIETTYRAELAGSRVQERPILFVDRVRGSSKMGWPIIAEAMRMVIGLRARPPRVDRIPTNVG